MKTPVQITYRHTESSEALNELIHEKAHGLEEVCERITACRVVIEPPTEHHRLGKGAHFIVRIDVSVPHEVLVVTRDPALAEERDDAFLAVSDAFHTMRQRLEDYVDRQRERRKGAARA